MTRTYVWTLDASNKCKPRTYTWPTLGKCVTFSHWTPYFMQCMRVHHTIHSIHPSCASTRMAKCTTTWINRKDFCWIHLQQYLRELRRAELKMWHSMLCWLICFIASFELLVFGGSQAFAFCIFHIVWQWSLLLLFSSTECNSGSIVQDYDCDHPLCMA